MAEYLVVGAIVLVAAFFVGRKAYQKLTAKTPQCSCGCCSGCKGCHRDS